MSALRSARFGAVVLALVFTGACAPGVHVRRKVAAPDDLVAGTRLAVVEVRGGPEGAAQFVYDGLMLVMTEQPHWQLSSALAHGFKVDVPGPNATVDVSAIRQKVDADYYLVAYLTDYRQVAEFVSEGGTQVLKAVATARLTMQVLRASDGKVVVFRDVSGRAVGTEPIPLEARDRLPPSDVQPRAMKAALATFTAFITPRYITETIELDDAEELRPGNKLAQRDDWVGALAAWQTVLVANPNHAGATYNTAVVNEARGDVEAAKTGYRRAVELAPQRAQYRVAEQALLYRLGQSR